MENLDNWYYFHSNLIVFFWTWIVEVKVPPTDVIRKVGNQKSLPPEICPKKSQKYHKSKWYMLEKLLSHKEDNRSLRTVSDNVTCPHHNWNEPDTCAG